MCVGAPGLCSLISTFAALRPETCQTCHPDWCRFDRCICIIDLEKLGKPREALKRIRDSGKAGFCSLALDAHNNVLLTGSLDGALRVWSVEGRCLDRFDGLSSAPVHVAHLPHLNVWWATGRAGRIAVIDPRAPALITQHVAAPNQLLVSGLMGRWGLAGWDGPAGSTLHERP